MSQHAEAYPEVVEGTPSLLLQTILNREKKDFLVYLLHPTLSCKALS